MRWLLLVLLLTGCSRETPLTRAAATGSVQEVQNALRGASLDETQGALIAAIRNGNTSVIPLLVQAGAVLTTPNGVNDWTPLEHAVHKRQLKSVQALLDAGAPVNQLDAHRRTALRWAAGNGYSEIVKVLLDRGADPRMEDEDGINALDSAIFGLTDIDNFTAGNCQTETIKVILAKAPGLKPSQKASRMAANMKNCGEIQQLIATR
jgi:ankyrin repeat protein